MGNPATKFNPFRPNSMVGPFMFSGRADELIALERALVQTKFANPQHFLITGERGIGKSSLLLYLQYLAKGDVEFFAGKFSFLTVSVDLEPTTTYIELIKKIGAEFQRVVASQEKLKEMAKAFWEFIQRWEVASVKYTPDSNGGIEPHQLLDDLVYTISTVVEKFGDAIDGVLILIDEADKPPVETNLGEFCKLFTERLTKRGCNKVALGLAGLPETLDKLKASHESSARVFQILTLKPLQEDDCIAVIRKGLALVKKETGLEVTATPDAEKRITQLSDGYPHFIQQFAYCACEQDNDNNITIEDVDNGAVCKNGALEQLGSRYFHDLYFDQINSDEYRGVLRFMAEHGTNWLTKDQIRKAVNIKATTLSNAIGALKTRHIIIPQDGKAGVYRLPTSSFAAWIRAFTEATPPRNGHPA
jgi:hypothetical protein